MIKILLFISCFLGVVSPAFSHSIHSDVGSKSWPDSTCHGQDSWLIFTWLSLCAAKEDVLRVENLNLSQPTTAISLRLSNTVRDLTFLWFEEEAAIAGIHKHLGVKPVDVFTILTGELQHKQRAVIEKILSVNDKTRITVYKGKDIMAYVLIGLDGGQSSIYVFRPEYEGLIKVAGAFEHKDVSILLPLMQVKGSL